MSAIGGKIRVHNMIVPMILGIGGVPRKRWLNISAEPVETGGKSLVIVAVDDITRQRRSGRARNITDLSLNRCMKGMHTAG